MSLATCLLKMGKQKEKTETRIEQKPVVAVGSIISLSFHSSWMCASQNRSCTPIVNRFHCLHLVPMFSVLIPGTSNTQTGEKGDV